LHPDILKRFILFEQFANVECQLGDRPLLGALRREECGLHWWEDNRKTPKVEGGTTGRKEER
jgi:hypothetical protein